VEIGQKKDVENLQQLEKQIKITMRYFYTPRGMVKFFKRLK
jgi:hypothetical protein